MFVIIVLGLSLKLNELLEEIDEYTNALLSLRAKADETLGYMGGTYQRGDQWEGRGLSSLF